MSACQSTLQTPDRRDSPLSDDYAVLLRDAERARNPASAARLRLEAARVLTLNGDAVQALSVLDAIAPADLPEDAAADYFRTLARANLLIGDTIAAENAFGGIPSLEDDDFLLLADICSALARYRCAADAWIQASINLGMGAEALPTDIHDRIWFALGRAQQGPSAFTHRYHHAWWLLQQEVRNAPSITGQVAAWQRWQRSYPSHPARLDPPTALQRLQDYQLPAVALLLPLSGNLAGAGNAVRDGLIAAYLSEDAESKPQIKFYDSASEDLAAVWERALAGGADVVVGPLIKDQVERFADITAFSEVPRLLLNYLDQTPGIEGERAAPGLFQIGVAIEDEAGSLARHVLAAGHEKVLVVHSQDRWARRAMTAFREQWPYPVTMAPFVDIRGLTGAVGEAMQVAASETRKNEIANILGQQLEFLPRARGDLDGIIALTTQVEAEALVPALRFHFADDLPVYATSQVARGEQTRKLAGFRLTEMPVFADPTPEQAALTTTFGLMDSPYAELYALGFDAYRLATWLPILDPATPVGVPAAMGYLWLQDDGAFRRDLRLAEIHPDGFIPLGE